MIPSRLFFFHRVGFLLLLTVFFFFLFFRCSGCPHPSLFGMMTTRYLVEEVEKWNKWLINLHRKHLEAGRNELKVAFERNAKGLWLSSTSAQSCNYSNRNHAAEQKVIRRGNRPIRPSCSLILRRLKRSWSSPAVANSSGWNLSV